MSRRILVNIFYHLRLLFINKDFRSFPKLSNRSNSFIVYNCPNKVLIVHIPYFSATITCWVLIQEFIFLFFCLAVYFPLQCCLLSVWYTISFLFAFKRYAVKLPSPIAFEDAVLSLKIVHYRFNFRKVLASVDISTFSILRGCNFFQHCFHVNYS